MSRSTPPRRKSSPTKLSKIGEQQKELKHLVRETDTQVLPIVQNIGFLSDVVKYALDKKADTLSPELKQEVTEFVETTQKDSVEFAENICTTRKEILDTANEKVNKRDKEQVALFMLKGFENVNKLQQQSEELLSYHQRTAEKAKTYFTKLESDFDKTASEVHKLLVTSQENEGK